MYPVAACHGYGAGSGSAGGFSPLSLSPALWLDAGLSPLFQNSNGTTPATADTNPVGYWGDISGNGNHIIQATAGCRPMLKLAIQNNLPAIRFDGVNDFLAKAFTLGQPAHLMFTAKLNTWVDGKYWVDAFTADTMIVSSAGTNGMSMYAGNNGPALDNVAGAWGVFSCLFNGASSLLRLNDGTAVTSPSVGVAVPDGVTLGARAGGTGTTEIDYGAFLAFPAALSTANETLVRNYLNSRWGAF